MTRALFLPISSIIVASALISTSLAWGDKLVDKYRQADGQMQQLDVVSRRVMSSLYQINFGMNRVSKKRNRLGTELISVTNRAERLARSIADLENQIKSQKSHLSRRLRAMYMIGNEGVARSVFSSSSALELDQSLKYLKIISEHDIKLIESYRRNVAKLSREKRRLNDRVRHLLRVRRDLKAKENELAKSQGVKSNLLKQLSVARRAALERLAAIRVRAGDPELMNLINLSFYDHKGVMAWPVNAKITTDFGFVKSSRYHYVLEHRGYDFHLNAPQKIISIFPGRVAFVGELPGYDHVVILDHGDHYYSVYAHLDRPTVSRGQSVLEGQPLAMASQDLYFEIRHFSDAIDPKPWLNKNRGQL